MLFIVILGEWVAEAGQYCCQLLNVSCLLICLSEKYALNWNGKMTLPNINMTKVYDLYQAIHYVINFGHV